MKGTRMDNLGPRFLYLHGFASGPGSKKGVVLSEHYAQRGVTLSRLNMRLPSFERLRVSAMLTETRQALGGPADRAVLFGSSLGGFVAAKVAALDARVAALVLLAPAFRLVPRWQERLGPAAWQSWLETGWLETPDYTTGKTGRVDFGFIEDLQALDNGGFPDVRVPTLILHGKRDEVVDVATSRAFAHGRRHVQLVELDDGHELTASLPLIAQAADAFLSPFIGSDGAAGGERRAYSVAVYPRCGERVLLIKHRRLGVWLPPGGECLLGERPQEAAARELQEETGLRGHFPITTDIEGTPAGLIGYEEHLAGSKGLHLNFVFVMDVESEEVIPNDEFESWRWVTLADGPWAEAPRNVQQLAVRALLHGRASAE
jgi:8-oxo-dGTP pyrophosphatase MutT (NUDIX family)/pimeloyl-ACP methyl ester carboxylesterase